LKIRPLVKAGFAEPDNSGIAELTFKGRKGNPA